MTKHVSTSADGRTEILKYAGSENKEQLNKRLVGLASRENNLSWLYNTFYIAKTNMEGLANALSTLSHSALQIGSTQDACSVFLFSKEYKVSSADTAEAQDEAKKLEKDFNQVVWLTYRRNFIPIQPPSGYTSDTGWGCMLRSAQMIMAETLQKHLGTAWRFESGAVSCEHKTLLRWFIDAPKVFSFYSIHRMAEFGRRYGKKAGEWYGPTTVAWVLRDLVEAHRSLERNSKGEDHLLLLSNGVQDLTMLVADNGTICVEDIKDACEEKLESSSDARAEEANDPLLHPGLDPVWTSALFLLVPVRLGLQKINPDYLKALSSVLKFPQCVGMIGGSPAHSLYFVGSQDSQFLYLDPHTVHDAATDTECGDPRFPDETTVTTYHCSSLKFVPGQDIDPSLAIGFYCKSVKEFIDLRGRIGQLAGPPFLSVVDKRPNYEYDFDIENERNSSDDDSDDGLVTASEGEGEKGEPKRKKNVNTTNLEDEFVLLP
eukprot:CAMPEP_0184006612 /NCGR_PEP_ID=MMETSP0954-20121128/804_1 /TAXON_ID=627963 /ORGANISM="Aplanochytrium sp, Strain PBS07" /LENGTH=487 /DNA_ID=CAMNT_0026285209 /DNA_START=213 /DNA_END=1676 /DNA_ORIENTATION=+